MWNSIKTVCLECWENRYRMFRLAMYDLKAMNHGTLLGGIWNLLNPAMQISVYWFVFEIGLNSGVQRGGYPYIIWLMVGIIPWFFISNVLSSATTSIYSFRGILKNMSFPLAIVPVKSVSTAWMAHFWSMLIVLIIYLLAGYHLGINSLFVFYFDFCAFAFLSAYALFASSITVLVKDFQKLMSSIIRLLFYISPVVWEQGQLREPLRIILKLNPFAYIIDGYRESILYNSGLTINFWQGVYFWILTFVLFFYGCYIHIKFRKQFIDLL